MCQSKADGGRRCRGTGRQRWTTVPSREEADRLAAELPADRKGWDGSVLSDKDRRLYALRESGWTGPIDQDGYPSTTGKGAEILRRLAEQRGERVDW